MSTYRTSMGFARLRDAELNSFAETVLNDLDDNPSFPGPVVTLDVLQAAQVAFSAAIIAAADGGTQATAAKDEARATLIGVLRQEAAYVQSIAGEDLSMLLSSGFKAMSNNRMQIALPQPVVEKINNPMSGQLGLRLQPVPTARAYEVQVRYGTNGWEAVGVFTDSRSIIIPDLTPGTVYTLQARAIGGSTGYSDWSDPISHMSM